MRGFLLTSHPIDYIMYVILTNGLLPKEEVVK